MFERAARAVVLDVRLERDGTQDGFRNLPRPWSSHCRSRTACPGPPVALRNVCCLNLRRHLQACFAASGLGVRVGISASWAASCALRLAVCASTNAGRALTRRSTRSRQRSLKRAAPGPRPPAASRRGRPSARCSGFLRSPFASKPPVVSRGPYLARGERASAVCRCLASYSAWPAAGGSACPFLL